MCLGKDNSLIDLLHMEQFFLWFFWCTFFTCLDKLPFVVASYSHLLHGNLDLKKCLDLCTVRFDL